MISGTHHKPGHSELSGVDMEPKPSLAESFPGTFNVDLKEETLWEVVSTVAAVTLLRLVEKAPQENETYRA